MSSEAFTTAMFLITAIIAAGVLINAVFPVIYTLAGTISSSSHNVDERLSTDVKIVTTYASGERKEVRIWLKNVGTSRISPSDIGKADVFLGARGTSPGSAWYQVPVSNQWTYAILEDTQKNNCWDPGETLYIQAHSDWIPETGEIVYFQFVLPTGVSRSTTFTAGIAMSAGPLVASGIGILLLVVTAYVLVGGTLATTEVMVEAQGNLAIPGSPDADGDRDPEHDPERPDPLCRGEEHRERTDRRHPADRRLPLHGERRSRLCPLREGGCELLEQCGDRPGSHPPRPARPR